jgi:calcineurin-like phosphoesterase family protein
MSRTFLISDTHFGHSNILTFKKKDGSFLRPDFKNIKDHDLELIKRWNYVVKPEDKVYHLGDVGLSNFPHIKNIFDALNGNKVLIKGNHDNLKLSQYAQIFRDIRAYHILDKIILSHVPIHPESLSRWKGNVHGHLHENKLEDSRYMNICVEHTNFTPIDFEEVREYFNP